MTSARFRADRYQYAWRVYPIFPGWETPDEECLMRSRGEWPRVWTLWTGRLSGWISDQYGRGSSTSCLQAHRVR